jgi:splicing factor U2AF subunit
MFSSHEFLSFPHLESIHSCNNHHPDLVSRRFPLSFFFSAPQSGQLVLPEYSPVSDFREARCRQFDESSCTRGGYCNFMHLKRLPGFVLRRLRAPERDERGGGGSRSGRGSSSSHSGSSHNYSYGGGGSDRRGSSSSSNGREYERRRSPSPRRDRERSHRDSYESSSSSSSSAPSSSSSSGPERSHSEERRQKIAKWNAERAQRAAAGEGSEQ